jgi:hypothetical protein
LLSLFCRNAPVAAGRGWNAADQRRSIPNPWISTRTADFDVRGKLTNADGATPPLDCGDNVDNRPCC